MSEIELSRILQMVDHYGVPLRFAKQFAKNNDWKKRAGVWQNEHDPAKKYNTPIKEKTPIKEYDPIKECALVKGVIVIGR